MFLKPRNTTPMLAIVAAQVGWATQTIAKIIGLYGIREFLMEWHKRRNNSRL